MGPGGDFDIIDRCYAAWQVVGMVVERYCAWRLAKDFEATIDSAVTFLYAA
jgi:hypothetical protein